MAWFTTDPATGSLLDTTNAIGAKTSFGLDTVGNDISVTDPLQHVTQIYRNGYGLTQQVIDPLGHAGTIGYSNADASSFSDPYGRTSTLTHDALGRVDSATDAIGNTTSFQRDNLGRLVTVTDPLQNKAQVVRNANGSIDTLQLPGHAASKSYGYDPAGRLNTAKDELGRSWTAKFDGDGNITQYVDELLQKTKYTYDPFDRPATFTFNDQSTLTFGFDNGNRLLTVADSQTGQVTVTPDARDFVSSVQTPYGTTKYDHDDIGRTWQVTYPVSGLVVLRQYDNANRLQQLTVGNDTFKAVYEDNGRLKTLTLPNGAVRTQTYIDPGDDLQAITYTDATGTVIGNWAYTYDGIGRLQNNSGSFFTPIQPSAFNAGYDDADQITSNGGTTLHPAADGSQLDDVNLGFTYDARGRLSGAAKGTAPANVSATYQYNALGERDTKTVVDNTGATPVTTVTHYFYDLAGHLLLETDGNLKPQYEYVWFGGMPVMVRIYSGSTATEYLIYVDRQDAPRRVTDFANNMRWIWDSDPHGNGAPNSTPTAGLPAVNLHLRFPGQIADSETGMYHNGARDYNPKTGRYVQADPLGLGGGDFNIHSYVGGDPINGIDPSGMGVTSVDEYVEFYCPRHPIECADTVGPEWAKAAEKAAGYAAAAAAMVVAVGGNSDQPGSANGGEAEVCNGSEEAAGTPAGVPPVPDGFVGDQGNPLAGTSNSGKRHTSGPLTPANGGTGDAEKDFDKLTGGTGKPFPESDGRSKIPGAQVGDNGIWMRPGTKNPGDGPRIEIPGNGGKLPETLHY